MVMVQNLTESEIAQQDSPELTEAEITVPTQNILPVANFNITGLYPEKYINHESVPMEKGIYHVLQRKYLKTHTFCICGTVEGPVIEEYAFSIRSCKDSINFNTLDLCVFPNFRDISLLTLDQKIMDQLEKEAASSKVCWKTYISMVSSKPEVRLLGCKERKQTRLEDLKTRVRACEDQRLTRCDLVTHFGESISRLCKDEEEQNPAPFYCWFDSYENEETSVTYENQILKWQRKVKNPFKNEGTRVPRKWIKQSNDPAQVKTEERRALGPVRNQGKHHLCWAFVAVNLVSSLRLIEGVDDLFAELSVRQICFYESTYQRSLRKGNHQCYPAQIAAALGYIRRQGVAKKGVDESDSKFCCRKDWPKKKGDIRISGYVFLKDDLYAAIKQLETQPIGASLAIFSDYWDITTGIYRGPSSNDSIFEGFHGVVISDAFYENGELVFLCKSSHGTKRHSGGYVKVSASVMVMGCHYEDWKRFPTPGIYRGEEGSHLDLTTPTPLLRDFIYPVLATKANQKNKRRRTE